jgi:hypothetical protein
MVNKKKQHPPPPPTAPLCQYILCKFTLGRGGGVGQVREKAEGQQFTRGVENTNMTYCISSIKAIKHQWRRNLGFCVCIVPSFMFRGLLGSTVPPTVFAMVP